MTVETTELSLPSRIDTIATAAAAVAEFVGRSGISDDAAFGIDMAVREAVTNAVLHGNRQDEEKTVDIILKSSPDAVEISVHDQGPGFQPGRSPRSNSPREHLKSLRPWHLFHAQFYGRSRLVDQTRRWYNGAHAQATLIRNCIKEISEMAELNINERQAGDVTVLDMSGKITIGEGSVALRTAIRRLLEEGKKRILLNLAGVGYIDSSGIGELVSSYTAINKEGGQLKLLNLTQKLQDLLTITKLLTVFDVYENEAEALNSFK